jgi:hypothetical protein
MAENKSRAPRKTDQDDGVKDRAEPAEFERLKRDEQRLRARIERFTTSDSLPRDEIYRRERSTTSGES